jgi:integrase
MARSIKSKKLDSRTARRAIPQGKATHWLPISRGRALGYRRGRKFGMWVARFDAENLRREEKLGEADDVLDADGVRIFSFAQALEKAQRFFVSALAEATGEMPRGGPYSVADAVKDYLKSLENRGAPDHPGAVYDFQRNVLPQLGAIEVARLTRPRIEGWRAKLAERPRLSMKKPKKDAPSDPPKPMNDEQKRQRRATTNRTVRRLVAALNSALATGKVNANPMNWKLAPFENAEVARSEYLTEAQQREFVAACSAEPDFQNLVLAGLHTGCRLGELARLRVNDFVASSNTVYVEQSKSGNPRHVFLDEQAAQFCKRLASHRGPDELLLPRKHRPDERATKGLEHVSRVKAAKESWDKNGVKLPMRRACQKAKIQRLGFHQLRHSFSTRLLTRGVPMKIVAQQLGHTSVRMLEKHYGHFVDEHLQQVISALPSVGLNEAAKVKRAKIVAIPSRRRSA